MLNLLRKKLAVASLEEKEQLIKEIRGVQRIVINTAHGGFGLSNDGVLRYLELCNVPVWSEVNSGLVPFKYWLVPPGEDRITNPSANEWSRMSMAERQAHNQKYSQQVFCDRDIPRDDPFLVQTVLELGEKSHGSHAELKVVEVPGDVDWVIDEYDGREWVAEVHRTWS